MNSRVILGTLLWAAIALRPEVSNGQEETPAPPVTQLPEVTVQAPRILDPSEVQVFETPFPGSAPGETKLGMTVPGSIPWSSNAIRRDSDAVGPYGSPVWTTQRPFSTTRTYVLPPGQAQFEQWVRPTWGQEGKPKFRFLEELALGLPGRFQLDIYDRWHVEPNDDGNQQYNHEAVQIELRWAVADWGVIPLNPTFYIEWVEKGRDDPNVYEAKLLLAEQITPKLFYASNFILEQETGGAYETELGWSNAIATPLIERRLLAGVEMLLQRNTVHGERGDPEDTFRIGPSFQLRPTNRTYITSTALFGTTEDSPICQAYFIFGYQFGFRAGPTQNYLAPSSTIGN